MSIKEREELLFQKLREKDPDIVADGVICEQLFLNARYKIVYILKEVNGGKSWDLRDFVYEGGRPQTWDNIARWTEGILSWEKEFPWSEMEMDNEQRRLGELKKIAAVNLKKTSGDILQIMVKFTGQQLIIMTLSRSRLICIKQTLLFAVARSMLLWMHVIRTERLTGK